MKQYINAESFGAECPENWEEIAEEINTIINKQAGDDADQETVNEIWDKYFAGEIGTVTNSWGVAVDFKVAVNMMDDGIREKLHMDLAPCTQQEFFDKYAEEHETVYGEEWELDKEHPVY